MSARELNFDGLVGPTHHYAGQSPGNLASLEHKGEVANPRAAALEGLEKMRFVAGLGVGQAVLPPQPRPDLETLRRLGFRGDDAALFERARRDAPELLSAVYSASSMWTANAATVAPSSDSDDGRVHLVPANLTSLLHRSLEAPFTTRALRAVFADARHFEVSDPLPATEMLADEGAANHLRLATAERHLHLFAWGRSRSASERPFRHPARQAREASEAVSRLLRLTADRSLFWQQHPSGIDAGAFHTDVLAAGHDDFLMLHELAFLELPGLLAALERAFDGALAVTVAGERELPVAEAVARYPFNSELVTLPDGATAIIAPAESEHSPRARAFLERVVRESGRVAAIHYVDVNASMRNGGGPACLRLRVRLRDDEERALGGRVSFDGALDRELTACIERRYRDRLSLDDLSDPELVVESRTALDEITAILGLGAVYDFQR